jgi:hypothetical protein
MKGGVPKPLDIIVILDTTNSMDNNCSASVPGVSNPDRLDCAKEGMRALLRGLWPCPDTLPNCGTITNGHVANPVDEVGLMVFPGLKTTTALSQQFDCTQNLSGGEVAAYGASPAPVYLMVPLVSDYKLSANGPLNGGGSNLVKAVEWASGNTCTSNSYGLETPAGQGTYFAHVITQAHNHLVSAGRPDAQDVIILLGDGDANWTGTANPCQDAWSAASAAAAAGTWIYSIAYGASTSSSSCPEDSPSSVNARQTMQNVASDPTKFYNQPGAGDLEDIFEHIVLSLTTTRLLLDDTI